MFVSTINTNSDALSLHVPARPSIVCSTVFVWQGKEVQWGVWSTLILGRDVHTQSALDELAATKVRAAVQQYGNDNVVHVMHTVNVPQPTPNKTETKE